MDTDTDTDRDTGSADGLTPVLYSASWCGFCRRLKHDLDAAGIGYREVDVDLDDAAAALVTEINHGNRTVPTVVFADGSSLTNPAATEVSDRLLALR